MSQISAVFYILAKSLIYKNKFTWGIKCCHSLNCESYKHLRQVFYNFLGTATRNLWRLKKSCMTFWNATLNLNIKQNVLCLRVALWGLFSAVLHIIVLSNLFFCICGWASNFCFISWLLFCMLLHSIQKMLTMLVTTVEPI